MSVMMPLTFSSSCHLKKHWMADGPVIDPDPWSNRPVTVEEMTNGRQASGACGGRARRAGT